MKLKYLSVLLVALFFYACSSGNKNSANDKSETYGCQMKVEIYDKAEVFAPLAAGKNQLPSRVSLERFAPKRLSQGQQGSCVGWASAYAARTILESVATGKDPNSLTFSPSFLYNQIGMEDCNGSYVVDAMKTLMNVGAISFNKFPYDDKHCDRKPNDQEKGEAQEFVMRGYNRLTMDDDNYTVDMLAMKQNLAQGAPVVIGMSVGGTFEELNGIESWIPNDDDYNNKDNFGGHALCVIGYDDNKDGGSFQIMNSWGDDFGANGIFWMPYQHFEKFTNEAYGLYPLESKRPVEPVEPTPVDPEEVNPETPIDPVKPVPVNPSDPIIRPTNTKTINVSFGLVDNSTQNYIQLKKKSGCTFQTKEVQAIGTKFKIEVTNETECYTYVFGQDTDNSSYVLFPYTAKHSAFCGIVGTRLFPKDYSMKLDKDGTTDVMAIIVSKKQLNFQNVNVQANNNIGNGNYEAMLRAALKDKLVKNVEFKDGEVITITEPEAENGAVLMIIEINKK